MASPFIVAAVQQYAIEHYAEGWDVVAETYTADEIASKLDREGMLTQAEAIRYFQKWVVDVWKEQLLNTRFGDGEY